MFRKIKPVFRIVLLALLASALLGGYLFYDLPSIDLISKNLNHPSVKITDRNGKLLYEIISAEGGRNAVLDFANIPQCMKDATIAVEDKNFYQNPGIDVSGIVRAFWINLKGGETLAGGSTITQQVARILLLSADERAERSLRRKLRESVLAWQITQKYSKDEILALYLNQVYYGGVAYGIEAAAQTYFGKPANELILPECALLAGLPQTPGVYNPFTNPELALARQRTVLGLMEKNGYITQAQRSAAENTPLSYNAEPYPIEAPHFIWLIKDQLDELAFNQLVASNQSLVVRTTLDLDLQQLAEEIVKRRLASFVPLEGQISHNVKNVALIILNPQTGEILSMLGSADYFDSNIQGALNMTISKRQTGSAFKPIIYAAALNPSLPQPLTAGSTLLDVATTFETNDTLPYAPVNYDLKEHGYVSVREALASSLNIPATLTLEHVGIPQVVELAHQLGIESLSAPQDYDLSLALGGGQMTLLELSSAYAAFANHGKFIANSVILDIRNADGELLYEPKKAPAVQVIDPQVAWLISDILSDDQSRQTGFGLNSILKLDRVAAVKTGTTTNFHDNWTIGYTPDLVVGVWVGNSNYEAMHNVTGLTGAAPIWHEVMRSVLAGKPDKPFIQPDGLVQVEICALSGMLPTAECPYTKKEWYIYGTQPKIPDTFYKQILIDAWTNTLANNFTPPERVQALTVLDVPPEAQAWARSQGLPLLIDYSENQASDLGQLRLTSPVNNTTYRLDLTFDLSAQQILVEALGNGFAQVTLYVDGNSLGSFSEAPYQVWWRLSEGKHQFWVEGVNLDGELVKSETATIEVVK
ncbi:MAG: penicillin-binding protein 1C [Anaerolineales bacterium]|nr:penicillin-binding protein 1C [Anaerolineales bacterium]